MASLISPEALLCALAIPLYTSIAVLSGGVLSPRQCTSEIAPYHWQLGPLLLPHVLLALHLPEFLLSISWPGPNGPKPPLAYECYDTDKHRKASPSHTQSLPLEVTGSFIVHL